MRTSGVVVGRAHNIIMIITVVHFFTTVTPEVKPILRF